MARSHPSREHRLIHSLRSLVNAGSNPRYVVGIGDDAAVRAGTGEMLALTADSQIEGTHFSLSAMNLTEVGYRAMAVNLSDCAAMGAMPDGALVQVVVPRDVEQPAIPIKRLYRGISRACERWAFPVVGGDIARGPCWMIAVTLLGRIAATIEPRRRVGARSGDELWVTGRPGESAAGRRVLQRWPRRRVPRRYRGLVARHIAPCPRLEAGEALAADDRVHTVIDVSDGISKEVHTLAFENGLGIELYADALPRSRPLQALASELAVDPVDWIMHGGEDYELLFAAAPGYAPSPAMPLPLSRIGRFIDGTVRVVLRERGSKGRRVANRGWDHA
jgi:thiamine-monophosphate kinase